MFEVSQCAKSKVVPCNVRKMGKFVFNTVFISHSFFLDNFTLYSCVTASVLRTSVFLSKVAFSGGCQVTC